MLRSNTIAPLKIAALFDEHLTVLSKDQEVFVTELMAKEPPMSLEDFEDLLQDLDGQSESIRLKCSDVVCTGIYRCSHAPRALFSLSWYPTVNSRIDNVANVDTRILCAVWMCPI